MTHFNLQELYEGSGLIIMCGAFCTKDQPVYMYCSLFFLILDQEDSYFFCLNILT